MDELTLILNQSETTSSKAASVIKAPLSFKLKARELELLASTLSRLLEGGLPLLRALQVLTNQNQNDCLKRCLVKIQNEIQKGKSFSQITDEMPKAFPSYYVQMIRTGEATGQLGKVLALLAEHLEKKRLQQQKVWQALTYPIFVLFTGFATFFVLMKVVLPKIVRVYEGYEGDLPWLTQRILAISDALVPCLLMMTLLLCIAVFVGARHRDLFDNWLMRLPVIGTFVCAQLQVRLTSMLSVLLLSGIPVLQAMEMAAESIPTKTAQSDLTRARELLLQGARLSDCLQSIRWLTHEAKALILSGEESGQLGSVFAQIAKDSEKSFDSKMEIAIKLIEPLFILIVGGVVCLIVMSALLPVFDMNTLLY